MEKYCIVVIGYNRVRSIQRLLESLLHVEFFGDKVDLKISLDHCGNDVVFDAVKDFVWPFGDVEVRHQKERLGLKNHILLCGDYLNEYDAIAVLEDDVVVSPAMYAYMKQSVKQYQDDSRIAGISLYAYAWNVFAKAPFTPQPNGKDVYFMQLAQSWGQIWMKESWHKFKQWYADNQGDLSGSRIIPAQVRQWSDKSWLKYHIQYCVENDLYFVYPYVGLSTCFEDVGEHCIYQEATLQVPLMRNTNLKYDFASLEQDPYSVYDVYFERKNVHYKDETDQVELDIYGQKDPRHSSHRYFASTNHYDYRIVKSYALEMRPAEENVIHGIEGNDIHLYDLNQLENHKTAKKKNHNVYVFYHYLYGNHAEMFKAVVYKILLKIKSVIGKH